MELKQELHLDNEFIRKGSPPEGGSLCSTLDNALTANVDVMQLVLGLSL